MPRVPMIFSSTPVWIPSVQWKSNIGFLPRLYEFLMPSPPACAFWKRARKFPLMCVPFMVGGWTGYSAETRLQEATCSQPYACHMSQMLWNFTLFSSTKIHVQYLWLWRGENRFVFLWRPVQLAMMTDTKFVVQSLYWKERSAGHQILEMKTRTCKSVKLAKEWVLSGTQLWHNVVSRKFIEA